MLRVSIRVLDRVPKSFFSGLGLGIALFAFSGVALAVVYWALRPFVWAALYRVPYSPPPGPYPPESGEWLFVKAIWFVSAIVLGFVATHVAGRSANKVLLTLLAGWFVLSLAAEPLQTGSLWRIALDYLSVPFGALLGCVLWRQHQMCGYAPLERQRDG